MNSVTGLNLFWYGMDPSYWLFIAPALILVFFAQSRVKKTFQKYSQHASGTGHTGRSAAQSILNKHGLTDVQVERTPGQLTDHFDPRRGVLRLSDATCDNRSVAAIAVASHEAGHALQHASGYLPNQIRSTLVPVAQLGSAVGPYLAFFGLFLSLPFLANVGIVMFAGAVLFYLVTLPVEFDASFRALNQIEELGLLAADELDGAKKVLRAAALTYVASAFMAFLSLLRLLLMARNSNDRRR